MKKRNIYEMTAQEIWDRIMEVENFRGRTANLTKVQNYKRMEAILRELERAEKVVKRIGLLPPASDHMNALVYMDLDRTAEMTEQGQALLAELKALGDEVYSAEVDGGVRLSFSIHDVWES